MITCTADIIPIRRGLSEYLVFMPEFNTIQDAIKDLQAGKMILVAEEHNPDSQGFLLALAENITADQINFMTKEAQGLVCLGISGEIADRLELPAMSLNDDKNAEAFTVSIDADPKFGVTTGISAADRAKTIQVAVAKDAQTTDLRRPGHIFPLRAVPGGVLRRVGQAEAAVDFSSLAGFQAAAVTCKVLIEDGDLARLSDLFELAAREKLCIVNLADLVAHRLKEERFVHREVKVPLPNKFDEDFEIVGYRDELSGKEHVALVHGDLEAAVKNQKSILVRMHSECLVSDLFGSLRSDDGEQLRAALSMIVEEGVGVFVYLRDEGRGLGLINQLKTYELQDQGHDTVEANRILGFAPDLRNFGVGAQILTDLGLKKIRLLTNNPKKIYALEGYDLEVTDRVAIEIEANQYSEKYLQSKKDKLGHL